MEPNLDLDKFLKTANCELRVALGNYQNVVAELSQDTNNLALQEKRQQLEDDIVKIGLKEKRYFNEMRKFPHLYKAKCKKLAARALRPFENSRKENGISRTTTSTTMQDNLMEVETSDGTKEHSKQLQANADHTNELYRGCIKEFPKLQIRTPTKLLQGVLAGARLGETLPMEMTAYPDTLPDMTQENFLKIFSLVPVKSGKRRAERTKRSTEDPQFIYESCGGKEVNKSDIDNIDEVFSPAKTPRKRGRPKIKNTDSLPTLVEKFPDEDDDEAKTSAASTCESNANFSNVNRKHEEPKPRAVRRLNMSTEEGTEPECTAMDVSELGESARSDVQLPGTSTDLERTHKYDSPPKKKKKVCPIVMYRERGDDTDSEHVFSDSDSDEGCLPVSDQSSTEETNMAQCKSCLNIFQIIADKSTEFKCLQCRELEANDKFEKDQLISESLRLKTEREKLEHRALELTSAITEQTRMQHELTLTEQIVHEKIKKVKEFITSIQAPSTTKTEEPT